VQETLETLSPPEHVHVAVGALPAVAGEPTRFTQVFQNLLSNALRFMDKPQGHVGIDCVDQTSHWLFSVSDDGPGIEEKYHAKIFQMFQTLAPRDEVESTGIGLALVKRSSRRGAGGSGWNQQLSREAHSFSH